MGEEPHPILSSPGREILPWPQGCEHVLHLVQEQGPGVAAGVARFIAEGLERGDAVVIIGAMERWRAHPAVRRAEAKFFDARALLAGSRPGEALNSILAPVRARHRGVRVFSELTDLLWRRGDRVGALALERRWNSLGGAPFSLTCACGLDALDTSAYEGPLQALGALHTHLVPVADCGAFDEAVGQAIAEVLEPSLVRMLHALSAAHRPAMHMPTGVALLFWLKEHMPRTAEKVLARSRARWTEH